MSNFLVTGTSPDDYDDEGFYPNVSLMPKGVEHTDEEFAEWQTIFHAPVKSPDGEPGEDW